MAKRTRSVSSGAPQSVGRLNRRMEFAGGSSGVLDPTTIPLPETSLQQFFSDEAKVQQFSQPVKPR
jgi:hypothetical protein